jgi:ADP-ribose pyrophosphatase YjhB (NUDIX family)
MSQLFRATKEYPYHLSVGAVLLNSKDQVCCHYFDEYRTADDYGKDFIILMSESLEGDEPLGAAAHRGLMEEFGAKAEIISFIGAFNTSVPNEGYQFEKTTVYFLCRLISQDEKLRLADDPESGSELRWLSLGEAITHMKQQSGQFEPRRTDLNQSNVLERVKQLIQ